MKHITQFESFLNEATSSEISQKQNEIARKIDEAKQKMSEIKRALSDQQDPIKQEIALLQMQKQEVKITGLKLDLKILDLKRAQLAQQAMK